MITLTQQIKKALKVAFPETKFSVKANKSTDTAYYISYTDGPGKSDVNDIVSQFQSVDRTEDGEILRGGNTYIFINRTLSSFIKIEMRDTIELSGCDDEYGAQWSERWVYLTNHAKATSLGISIYSYQLVNI